MATTERYLWRRFHGSSRLHAWAIDKYGNATLPGVCDWTQGNVPVALTPKDAKRPHCTSCISKVGTPGGMFGPR